MQIYKGDDTNDPKNFSTRTPFELTEGGKCFCNRKLEIEDLVKLGISRKNSEKPFVMGTNYNGSETSGYGTSDNSIKAIHTRNGHILKFTEDESIILTDKSGNEIIFDTVGSNITVTAPETMTFNCKNMNINVRENMTTSVGMNKSDSIGMNHTENVGMMKNISVGLDFMTFVVGKVKEFIQGNKESEVKKESTIINNEKGVTVSTNGTISKQAQQEVKINSGEKSKNH